jgi:hypothetical protein
MPTPLLKNRSPFEVLFKCKPDYKFLRTFGCACWPNLRPYNSNKLQSHSLQCLFLGYSPNHKRYKCINLLTKRFYISRDVVFDENVFPLTLMTNTISVQPHIPMQIHGISNTLVTRPPTAPAPIVVSSTHQAASGQQLPSPLPDISTPTTAIQVSPPNTSTSPLSPSTSQASTLSSPQIQQPPGSSHPMVTRAKNNIIKLRQLTNGTVRYPIPRALLIESTTQDLEHTCCTSTMKDPHWRHVMNVEFDALLKNQTLTLVTPASTQNVIETES